MEKEAEKLLKGLKGAPALIKSLKELGGDISAGLMPALIEVLRELRAAPDAPADGSPAEEAQDPLEGALSMARGTSVLTPRGKMDVGFCSDHVVFKGPKDCFQIPYGSIGSISLLDNMPQDPKKRVIILLSLPEDAAITYGKSTYRNIVIQTLSAEQVSLPDPKATGSTIDGAQATVFATLFGRMGVPASRFRGADPGVFASADGFCAVMAFIKISEGYLFPLADAICYIGKEPLFFPLEEIECAELCRAGGGASTFDLNIYLLSNDVVELGQIDRKCLGQLQTYLESRSIRIGPPTDSSEEEDGTDTEGGDASAPAGHGAGPRATGEDEDDEDESDEDFDPEAGDDDSDGDAEEASDNNEDEDSDNSDEDEDEDDFEVFSDDEISASQIRQRMQAEAAHGQARKKQKRSS